MATTVRITNLLAGSSSPPLASGDILPFVDVSDTTQSPQGSTVKITLTNFFANVPVPVNVTSASATAFAVGLAGATDSTFVVDASTALQEAGLKVTGAVAAGTVAVAVISSGSDANVTFNAKGTGTIGIGSVSTGRVTITPPTTITGALTQTGLATFNGGATVASGQTLTVSGATITGLTAASVGAGTFPAGAFVFAGAVSGITTLVTSSTINSQTISSATVFTGTVNVATSVGVTAGAQLYGKAATSVGGSATVITASGQADSGMLIIVTGGSAGNLFADLVWCATTAGATVIQSSTVSGAPAARTYTVVAGQLKLAMASGTYSISTAQWSF